MGNCPRDHGPGWRVVLVGNCPRDHGPGGELSLWGIVLGIMVLVESCPCGELS